MKSPGKYLNEELLKENMCRKDLALRTGVTEKHISSVINGDSPISLSFARKLGYVFYNAEYWIKLQNDFDQEKLKTKEENSIDDSELRLLKNLKEISTYLEEKNFIEKTQSDVEKIIELRNFLMVSNLTIIPQLSYNGAYRAQVKNNVIVDPYVLYAWQRMCEKETDTLVPSNKLNKKLLKKKIPEIKNAMSEELDTCLSSVQDILRDCGIAFKVVKNFRGAPVQGFIKKTNRNYIIMCLTFRGKRADTFWFTLFHEIGHIIAGDYSSIFVDFQSCNDEKEEKANNFARDTLINPELYKEFIFDNAFFTWNKISDFAKRINVPPYIVLGRLQRDEILDWAEYSSHIKTYSWS